jgi:Golgi SNAP receptor complex protein 1
MQVDEVISQAQATKGALAAQHSAFMEIQGKLKQLGDRFPLIHSLLGQLLGKLGSIYFF